MIALEASGGYERVVVGDLAAQGYRLRVLNPAQVRHFARAGGRRAKNDPLDAEMIARYAATFDGPTVIPDQPREALAEAMGSRALPVEHRTAVGNRRHGAVVPQIRETLQAQLAALARQIAALESFITATVAANEDLIRRTEIVVSVTGVAAVSSWAVLAWLPEIGCLSRKQIAALVGVAPFDRDRGPVHGRRHIAGGRKPLRDVLYMAALSAAFKNPPLAAFYQRLRAKGKEHKVAVIAVARRLVCMLNALIRDGRKWAPNHVSGIDPLSWTPECLGERSPRCEGKDRPIRLSSARR